MANDLEKLSNDYETVRENLVCALASRLDSLADKLVQSKIVEDIFICEIYNGEGYGEGLRQEYHITIHGFCNHLDKADSKTAAYEMIDYFQTGDIIYYLDRAEKELDKRIIQAQNENRSDMPDFSGFFDNWDDRNYAQERLQNMRMMVVKGLDSKINYHND